MMNNSKMKCMLKYLSGVMLFACVLFMFVVPVKAAALNKTKEQAVTWCKNKIGKAGVDYDGAYGVQCVDLIREYTSWLGKDFGPVQSGAASGYATQTIPSSYYTRYGNSTKPAAGDIFVWGNNAYGAGGYGHTGVIYEVGSSYYKYIDYDGVTHRGAVGTTQKNGIYNFTKIIRPNFKASSNTGNTGSTATFSQILSNDRFYIESAAGSSQYLTVYGHKGGNNINIVSYNSTLKEDIFTVSHVGSGYYKFKNYITGRCVDIQGSTFTSGTNVHQYEDNGHNEQLWGLVKAGNGYYYVRSKANTGLSLDVSGGKAANGTNIQVWSNNTANAQKWKFITDGRLSGKTIETGYYYIKSGVGNGQYLNVNGTNVEINNAKSANQIFYVEYLGTGRYRITHYQSGNVLDVPGYEVAYMGNNVDVAKYDEGRDQEWIIKESDGAYEIVNRINGCRVDIYNALTANGTNAGLHRKNGSKAQKYTFEKVQLSNNPKIILAIGSKLTEFSNKIVLADGTVVTSKADKNQFLKKNPMTVKVSSKTYKRAKLTKKKTFKIGVKKAKGKVTYKLNKKAKKAKIKVSAKGKVTIPRKCKKGTYKITVRAAGNSKYKPGKKIIKIKIK